MKEQLGKSFAPEVRPDEDGRLAAAVAAAVARRDPDEAGAARSIWSRPSRWSPTRSPSRSARTASSGSPRWPTTRAAGPASSTRAAASSFLEDTDGDGRFDKSTVFLDNLPFPTGVLPWRKGVLVCAAPDILYAEDTDGDGKADVVEKLYTGFGTENYQARVNSLQYGLDGWVYGSCGLFGGNDHVLQDRQDGRARRPRLPHQAGHRRTRAGDRPHAAGPRPRRLGQLVRLRQQQPPPALRARRPLPAPQPARRLPERRAVTVGADATRLFPLKADAQRFALSGPPDTVTAACGLGIYRDDLLGNGVHRQRVHLRAGQPARHTGGC